MAYKVPFLNLPKHYQKYSHLFRRHLDEVLEGGRFILRDEVREFEAKIADYLGVKYAIGVNSGSDALFLSLKALGIGVGDEVITVAHTFVATVAAIVHCGASPVLVDISDDYNMDTRQIERCVTKRTKAIIPVHMNGRTAEMHSIMSIAKRHNLLIIEDTAQGLGARFKGKMAGTFGITGCFSLHPMKLLGGCGDAGFVITDSARVARKLRMLRNHGQQNQNNIMYFGYNSRLDNLQAAIVLSKISEVNSWINKRRKCAQRYQFALRKCSPQLVLPPGQNDQKAFFDVFTSYVVRVRQKRKFMLFLERAGVEVYSFWSTPLHKQKALGLSMHNLPVTECISREVVSLPLYPELSFAEQDYVIDKVKSFFAH